MGVPPAIVRGTDDRAAIVRAADDREQIVRRPDGRAGAVLTHRPRRRLTARNDVRVQPKQIRRIVLVLQLCDRFPEHRDPCFPPVVFTEHGAIMPALRNATDATRFADSGETA